MIEDEVKQTRCTTCDAEHEYKHAKVPAPRRKKPGVAAIAASAEPIDAPTLVAAEVLDEVEELPLEPSVEAVAAVETKEPDPEPADVDEPLTAVEDEWPVHRPLIRATLPRPEGQAPERKPTDFTIRQSGGRFDGQRNGNKARGNRHAHHAQGQSQGQSRFGSRSGSGQSRHGGGQPAGNQARHGNRQGPSSGQRGGRPGQGGGHRPGQNRGPKRGR
jgi:hypothetical protein